MDVVLGAFIHAKGGDPFKSGKKLGRGKREPGDLTPAELAEYVDTFVGNARAFPDVRFVLLHDGLPADTLACLTGPPNLSFEEVDPPDPDHDNYSRRVIAFRDWLDANKDVSRAWFIDSNDVAFVTHPFQWLDARGPDAVAAGEEWAKYVDNVWFTDAWAKLPPVYGDTIREKFADRHAVTVGCFAGPRDYLLAALAEVCQHLDVMRNHFKANPPAQPVMLDMHAFAAVFLPVSELVTFKMNGHTAVGSVPSPLIHDRKQAMEHQRLRDDKLGPLKATLAVTQQLPGWCWDEKAEAMLRLVLDTKPRVCVELGVYGGRSLLAQAIGLQHNGAGVIYAVDPWTRGPSLEGNQFGPDTDKFCWSDDHLAGLYSQLVYAVAALRLPPYVRFAAVCSHNAAAFFGDGEIDILHIDGNHSAAASSRDVIQWLPKVRPGGYVWLDDAHWDSVRDARGLIEAECLLVKELSQPDNKGGCVRLYRRPGQ